MSATTVNAFPPLHSFNSSRSWFLAAIVLLHAGFFWVLTHGVTIGSIELPPPVIVDFLPDKKPDPLPPRPPEPPDHVTHGVVDPLPPPRDFEYREPPSDHAPTAGPRRETPPTTRTEGPGEGPRIIEPELDARYPFTEPEYPVAEIRQGHEGTVLLSLQILPNGRVGEVRIDRSSGYEKLDVSAAREARKWRMKPGTSGGKATAMWKKVPIKFQLKN
jgi:protein TonB